MAAFVSRAIIILLACFIYSSNRFPAIYEAITDAGLWQSWLEFPWLEPRILISWTIGPLIENLILMLVFLIGEKLKLNYTVLLFFILISAYFSHGMGTKGATSMIAFFAFFVVYIVSLKSSDNSHLKALVFSTATHSTFNLSGLYLQTLSY